jgi:hypothetical protein
VEFSWPIFWAVTVGNIAFLLAIWLVQDGDKSLPPRHGKIAETKQKFLYMEDFITMTCGDSLGVPLIWVGYCHLVTHDLANLWWALPVTVLSALGFLKMCLSKNHKPDYGFPAIGKISWAGILHLFYFGAGAGASALCVWNLFSGGLRGPVMWMALAGGAFYVACFAIDVKLGNFDPLKRETPAAE